MGFGTYLANGFKALAFKKEAVASIRDESLSFKHSLILTAIIAILVGFAVSATVAVLAVIGDNFSPMISLLVGVAAAIGVFVFTLIGAGITHLIARLFGGIASIKQYYAVWLASGFAVGVMNIPAMILGLIPILGVIISIAFGVYALCVSVFAIRETYTLSTFRAIMVVLVPLVVLGALLFLLMLPLILSIASMLPGR